MKPLVSVRSVTPLAGFNVYLEFTDGTSKEVDLEKFLRGPIFEPLRADPARFREVRVEPGARTISWPDGADVDPDVLYYGQAPPWARADPSRPAAKSVPSPTTE